jgi:hypothetical protein
VIKQIMVCDVTGEEIPEGTGMTLEWKYGTITERRLDASGNYDTEDVPTEYVLHISHRVMTALIRATLAGDLARVCLLTLPNAVIAKLKECVRRRAQ